MIRQFGGMIAPEDSFSIAFDAITPDPALAARTLDDPALKIPFDTVEPVGTGFYLLDDCDGRFVIDPDMGVISITDDALLETERDAIHAAHIKVIEPSGVAYELTLRLRLTGHVPQVVYSADEVEVVADEAAPAEPAAIELAPPETVAFAVFRAFAFAHMDALGDEASAFGALIAQPDFTPPADLAIALDAAPPAPASRTADWSL
ncbi:MAG: hypothetical protein ABUS48_05820 [Pseudomonadota bacterium]